MSSAPSSKWREQVMIRAQELNLSAVEANNERYQSNKNVFHRKFYILLAKIPGFYKNGG